MLRDTTFDLILVNIGIKIKINNALEVLFIFHITNVVIMLTNETAL